MLPNGKQRLFFSCFTVSSTSCRTGFTRFSTLSVRLLKLYSCFPTLSIGFIKSLQITIFPFKRICHGQWVGSFSEDRPLGWGPVAARQWGGRWNGLQQQRPPPVAETGSRCWGRGQQDASECEADAGSRNPCSCPKRKLPTRGPIPR